MTCWGVVQGGGRVLLSEPRELVLAYDREAPADQLRAVFPADKLWEELREVLVLEGGDTLFWGVVDEQNARLAADGLLIELVCRSREALLLDNEAEPLPLRTPSLESLGRRLLEPLGFRKITGPQEGVRGELPVEKGSSCWQVLAGFCREAFGTQPYVDLEGVVRCEGIKPWRLRLDRVISAQLSRMPCRRLSAVWKQGYRGGYDTPYRDPEAPVARQRYISAESGRSPRAVLEEARQAGFLLTVVCAGAWWPVRGGVAEVEIPRVGRFAGCPVRQAVYIRDSRGQRTKFVLERGEKDVADGKAEPGGRPETDQRPGGGWRGFCHTGGQPV